MYPYIALLHFIILCLYVCLSVSVRLLTVWTQRVKASFQDSSLDASLRQIHEVGGYFEVLWDIILQGVGLVSGLIC